MRKRTRPGLLVGLIALAVGVAFVAWSHGRRLEAARAADVATLTRGVEGMAPRAAALLARPSAEADAEIRQWAAASGFRVTLIAADGRVHADSWTLPALLGRLENHLERPELQAARAGVVGVAFRRSVTTDHVTVYVGKLVGPAESPAGYIRFAHERRSPSWPWLDLLGALAVALAVALAADRWESRQHRAVARHLASWAELPPGAELEALAEEADRRFRGERERLGREAEVTRAALAEVGEGVVLLDAEGVVRFANPAAERLLGRELAAGRPLVEAARAPEVLAAVQAALGRREASHTSSPGAGGAELAVQVCPLPHPLFAAAVVLRDLSGERQLERARRALVADLAHELRTPLTVLGALAEELEEEHGADGLVATLDRQIRRLRAFAEELEELAAIEAGQVPLHGEELDVLAAARQTLDELHPAAEKAGVALRLSGVSATVETDAVRLSQVLTNLVDNAIRYNREGGSVTLAIGRDGEGVRIVVEDTGIGIPAADLPLVFQRFYRVRRGASSEGGSGLGLAIVKHLVRALGGTVQLTSAEGKGTTVTLTLPAALPVRE